MGTEVKRCPGCKKRRRDVHGTGGIRIEPWGLVNGQRVCKFCVKKATTKEPRA